MIIREIKSTDLEQLSELFDGYRVFYRKEADIDSAKKFLADRLNNKDSEIFVCETYENKLVGFVQLYPLFSSTRMKKLWLLNDLFVNPEFRGKGISIKLIERAKKLVTDSSACGMFLETEKVNEIGNNLYPKTGFELNKGSNFYEWNNK
ncbi:GNAT family N-acetyltransferase [Aquimarina sediminis]|uniref:GNAT family N-acetyltransferase n=1 Tax=Aquimarina sediminis TaxID=2070536 RepID=UPI000CA00A4C|nr:GNAT family N-acetyltransferase [Aquimarina sediminis]